MKNLATTWCLILTFHAVSINSEKIIGNYNTNNGNFFTQLNIILGTEDGELLKIRSDNTDQVTRLFITNAYETQAITALAVYENYLLLVTKYEKLGIHSHASNTLSCPFDWNEIVVKKSCDLHPKLQIPNADSYLTSIVIKDNHLHTSDNYGNFYNCSLKEIEDECLLQENFNGTISGMDMNSINLYIAFESGKLLRCPLNSNLMASCKELYDDAYYWLGLTAVHVAYDALWLGTKNGQLLKCPLNNEFKESKLNCQEFAKMNWSWYTKPVVYNIQSKNGFLLAGWKGFTVNEMWRCDPDDAQKCGNIKFELPSRTRTFVIVD